ncbi:MAG: hypothetical protein R6V85_13240 [Polyangia bacterium]
MLLTNQPNQTPAQIQPKAHHPGPKKHFTPMMPQKKPKNLTQMGEKTRKNQPTSFRT